MKWHLRTTGILLGTVLVCAGMVYLFLTSPVAMILIRQFAEREIGRRIDRRMEIGGLRIDASTGAVVRDLRIFSKPDGQTRNGRPVLYVRRMELQHDALGWLRGEPPIAEIVLTEPTFVLRAGPEDRSAPVRETEAFAFPTIFDRIKIRSGAFEYRDAQDSLLFSMRDIGISAVMDREKGALSGRLTVNVLDTRFPGVADSTCALSGKFHIAGDSVHVADLMIDAAHVRARADGGMRFLPEVSIHVDVAGEADLSGWGRMVPEMGELRGRTELMGSVHLDREGVRVRSAFSSPRVETDWGIVEHLHGEVTYGDDAVQVTGISGTVAGGTIRGWALFDLTRAGSYDLELYAGRIDLSRLSGPFGAWALGGRMGAEIGLHGPDGLWTGSIRVSDLRIRRARFGDIRATASREGEETTVAVTGQGMLLRGVATLRSDTSYTIRADVEMDDVAPAAALFGDFELRGSARAKLLIEDLPSSPRGWIRVRGDRLSYRSVQVGDAAFLGEVKGPEVRIEATLTDRAVRASGRVNLKRKVFDDLQVMIEDLDLRKLLDKGPTGLLRGTLHATGPFDRPECAGEVTCEGLKTGKYALGTWRAGVSMKDHLVHLELSDETGTMRHTGTLDLTGEMPFHVRTMLDGMDPGPLLALALGRGEGTCSGTVRGEVEMTGTLQHPERVRAEARLDALTLSADGRSVHSIRPIRLEVDDRCVSVDTLELGGDLGTVSARGRIDMGPEGETDFEVAVENMPLVTLSPYLLEGDTLSGSMHARVEIGGRTASPEVLGRLRIEGLTYGPGQFGILESRLEYASAALEIPELVLRSGEGEVVAKATIPLRNLKSGGGLMIDARAHRLDLTPFARILPSLNRDLHGTMDGQVHLVAQPGDRTALDGTIRIDTLRIGSSEFELYHTDPLEVAFERGDMRMDSLRIAFRRLDRPREVGGEVRADGMVSMKRESALHVRCAEVDVRAIADLIGFGEPLSGILDARVHLGGRPEERAIRTTWHVRSPGFRAARADGLAGQAAYADGMVSLSSMRMSVGKGVLTLTGEIPIASDQDMDIRATCDDLDIGFLAGLSRKIESTSGRAMLSLSMTGTLGRPEVLGSLRIHEGEIKLRDLETPMRVPDVRVVFEDGRAELVECMGSSGAGGILVEGGTGLDGYVPRDLDFMAVLENADLTIPRTLISSVSGELRLTGDLDRSELAGVLRMEPAKVVQDLELQSILIGATLHPPSTPAPALENMGLQVQVEIPELKVENTFSNLDLGGNLFVRGSVEHPVITGGITGTEGYVWYLDRKFEIESVSVLLTDPYPAESLALLLEDPYQLDPELSVQARSEVSATDGSAYQVSLSLSGRPSDLTFELTSEPTLDRANILSLLTLGATGEVFLEQEEPGMLVLDRAAILGSKALLAATGRRAERMLGLDRVRIDANLFKRHFLGGTRVEVSKKLNPKTEVTYSTVVGYASRQKVQLDYRISDRVFVTTETDQAGASGMDLKIRFRFR